MQEIWKDIPNYEGIYQVSNLGSVKSLSRDSFNGKTFFKTKEKILSDRINKRGYKEIVLLKKGKRKCYTIHQLVAIAFLNHIPCGQKMVVDHINDIKTDNKLDNLQVITQRENACKTQGKYSSQYKGVHKDKNRTNWRACILIDKKKVNLGSFDNEYDAHLAYQNKLKEIKKGK